MIETVALFRDGNYQIVHLPEGFRFEGDRVFVRRLGKAVVLLPVERAWDTLIDSLPRFSDDFMTERDQPPQQDRAGAGG